MAEHELKVYPQFWRGLVSGRKPFELRRDDRQFRVGDTVSLKEYDPKLGYTGAGPYVREITYILRAEDLGVGLQPGYCVLGFAGA
jgi:hypothetical protein